MPFYLATKEMLRNKLRFIAVIAIIALITLLVLFIAALGDGLAEGAKEYIDNIDAELIVFRDDVGLSIQASRFGRSRLNDLQRIAGIEAVGPLGFSTASIKLDGYGGLDKLDVALIGVEPGLPGAPPVFAGRALNDERAEQVVIDQHVLDKVDLPLGSTITLKVLQGAEEQFYPLTVVGYTEGQKYLLLPGIFVPLRVWDKVKTQEKVGGGGGTDLIFNVAAVKLANPAAAPTVAAAIEGGVNRVSVTDPVTAYQNDQGFSEMQSVLNTQQSFVLLIVLLIIGGFFQVQTLQKVTQIGMLKAIGASNWLISTTLLVQVTLTTLIGLVIGSGAVLLLASTMPPGIPLLFNGQKIITTTVTLLVISPIAGLVSVRTLLKIEPLKALGLGV